jgi:predicted RNA-binding protein YlqC (UPF0109 family)
MPSEADKEPLQLFLAKNLSPNLHCSIGALAALLIYDLAKDPGEITVSHRLGDGVTVLEFDVGETNKGRIIGKHGHTIKALRSLCRSIAKGRGEEIVLDLVGWTNLPRGA